METSFRKIALGVVLASALLCVSSPNMRAEDPPDSGSVTTRPADDSGNTAAADDGQAAPAQIDPSSAGSGSVTPAENAATAATQKGFWARLFQAYYDDWHPSASAAT